MPPSAVCSKWPAGGVVPYRARHCSWLAACCTVSSLGGGSHIDGLTHRLQSCHRGYSTHSPCGQAWWSLLRLASWLQGARHSLPAVQCLVRADALWRSCQEKQSPSHVVPPASFFPRQTRLSLTVRPFSLQASDLQRSRLPPRRNPRAWGHSP